MNVELALEVIGAIELHPDNHDQDAWCSVSRSGVPVIAKQMLSEPPCGTTLCFAGWTAALWAPQDSVFIYRDRSAVYTPSEYGSYIQDRAGGMTLYDTLLDPDPRAVRYSRRGISEYARRALQINPGQAGYLFDPSRTVDELLSGVRCLIANPHATIDDMRVFNREERGRLPH